MFSVALWFGCAAPAMPDGQGGAGGVATGTGGLGCTKASDCDALGAPCVDGACVNGACEALPANELGACDDGLFCTVNDLCQDGGCLGGSSRFCPSSDECHISVCDEEKDACVHIAGNESATCEDGDACTLAGTCSGGMCVGAMPADCSVLDGPCTEGLCDPAVGCVAVPANEGGACDDAKSDPCVMGVCESGMCKSVTGNEGGICDDGLYCTVGETCMAGQCAGGTVKPCVPPSVCWAAACDEMLDACVSVPGNDGTPCDDGSPCTSGTACANGACLGGVPDNDTAACDDGLGCTSGEICSGAACVPAQAPFVYFAEDFSSNDKGWTLGSEWEIGPAKASMGGAFGSDPSADHSSTADNGIAGVSIGGNTSTSAHPFHYLESPSFNASAAPGSVILSFYRWLNSDFAPYMDNSVEVWDGTEWVILWTSGGPPRVQDSPPVGPGWTFIQHDITAYKNNALRIRFGVSVGDLPLKVGSWNLDAVVVADVACP